MRVLHAPISALYQPVLMTRGLRELGVDADLMYFGAAFGDNALGLGDEIVVGVGDELSASRLDFFLHALDAYDVFHFHSGYTLLPWSYFEADLRLLKKLGKAVVMSRWGCRDGRTPREWQAERKLCELCPLFGDSCTDEMVEKRLSVEEHNVDVILNHEPDFRSHNSRASFMNSAIDLDFWKPTLSVPAKFRWDEKDSGRCYIVHAVGGSGRGDVKGTSAIRKAVAKLEQEGLPVAYRELTGLSYSELRYHVLQADLVIDQLRYGSFGSFARESMAMGRPVVGHVIESQREYFGDLPIVEATIEGLEEVLTALIMNRERMEDLGRLGRAYAEEHFDHRKIAQELIEVYHTALKEQVTT